jgi:hypothetical protein
MAETVFVVTPSGVPVWTMHNNNQRLTASLRTLLLTLIGILAGTLGSSAETFCDFEPPTYTNNTSFLGVDGWQQTGGTPDSLVTPHITSGYVQALQGKQSALIGSMDHSRYRTFRRAGKLPFENGCTVSWLWQRPEGLGISWFYLSDNLAGGSTPVGIELDASGNILLTGTDTTDSGKDYEAGKTYRLEIVLDFTKHQFEAFVTNVTDNGPRTSLGTKPFKADLSAPDFLDDGGIFLRGNGATLMDDIRVNAPTSSAGK